VPGSRVGETVTLSPGVFGGTVMDPDDQVFRRGKSGLWDVVRRGEFEELGVVSGVREEVVDSPEPGKRVESGLEGEAEVATLSSGESAAETIKIAAAVTTPVASSAADNFARLLTTFLSFAGPEDERIAGRSRRHSAARGKSLGDGKQADFGPATGGRIKIDIYDMQGISRS
jgi:hypothetical protein